MVKFELGKAYRAQNIYVVKYGNTDDWGMGIDTIWDTREQAEMRIKELAGNLELYCMSDSWYSKSTNAIFCIVQQSMYCKIK
jgi:hypothetical protein